MSFNRSKIEACNKEDHLTDETESYELRDLLYSKNKLAYDDSLSKILIPLIKNNSETKH